MISFVLVYHIQGNQKLQYTKIQMRQTHKWDSLPVHRMFYKNNWKRRQQYNYDDQQQSNSKIYYSSEDPLPNPIHQRDTKHNLWHNDNHNSRNNQRSIDKYSEKSFDSHHERNNSSHNRNVNNSHSQQQFQRINQSYYIRYNNIHNEKLDQRDNYKDREIDNYRQKNNYNDRQYNNQNGKSFQQSSERQYPRRNRRYNKSHNRSRRQKRRKRNKGKHYQNSNHSQDSQKIQKNHNQSENIRIREEKSYEGKLKPNKDYRKSNSSYSNAEFAQANNISDKSFYIGHEDNLNNNLDSLVNSFLEEIQMLSFKSSPYLQLQQSFIEIVAGHLSFQNIYPRSESDIGRRLLANGLFHEMWGRVLKKSQQVNSFWVYYQRYQSLIQSNYSNFQSMFNQCSSTEDKHGLLNDNQEDSRTKLKQAKTINKHKMRTNNKQGSKQQMENNNSFWQPKENQQCIVKYQKQRIQQSFRGSRESFQSKSDLNQSRQEKMNVSTKQNEQPMFNKGAELHEGRLRLFGEIQTNERRLNAEIVCYFLNITKVYKLQSVQISDILQSYHQKSLQLVLMKGFVRSYSEVLGKVALHCQPKLLLIAYGQPNFGQLLRLKASYGQIEGLVVYDQLLELKRWLKGNGHVQDSYEVLNYL